MSVMIESTRLAYTNTREKVAYYAFIVAILLLAVLFLFPFYWMMKGAFQPSAMASQIPPSFLPRSLTLENFVRIVTRYPVALWFTNSAIVAASATFLSLLFGSLGGYAFAKRRFPGRELIFWILLTAMMMPREVNMVPLYILINRLGLMRTHPGMFLPLVAWPFGLFMMRQFMMAIPDELIQAAKVDGASEPFVFLKIVVPLSIPAFGTAGILYFVRAWNDYLWQLIVSGQRQMYTLPVGIAAVAKGEFSIDYGLLMAGAAIGAVPMVAIFLFFQKYFVKGLTMGGVKG